MSTYNDLPALSPDAFNRLAVQRGIPLLITGKLDNAGDLEPQHIEFIGTADKASYVQEGRFTALFNSVYADLVEMKRRESVALALAKGRCFHIVRDLSWLRPEEKQLVGHLVEARDKIDRLFMKQLGTAQYIDEVEARKNSDPHSRELFWRNLKPWSDSVTPEDDPFANALPSFPKKQVGVYPKDLKLDADFEAQKALNPDLRNQWSVVVRAEDGALKAMRFHEHYKTDMEEIAEELERAAGAIVDLPDEQSFHTYLLAAASAFRDGDWDAADKKWVAMNMTNSKFALRIAPDETYWDPKNEKAGFELWFALCDQDAAAFSKQVVPHVQEMENVFHRLVPQYPARDIEFDAPDFIEVILRGGDHRSESGAVIGQKLPNFSDEVSRMVVMTNYGVEEEQRAQSREKAQQLLVAEQAASFVPDKLIETTNTLLHEMTHSFGVRGATFKIRDMQGNALNQTTAVALGGANAQVMEELKAQTGGLYWIGWLKDRGVVSEEMAERLYTSAIMWAFGHISRGMGSAEQPRTYSQLAAIQVRHFLKTGAMSLEEGKFCIHHEKMHASIETLFQKVIAIQTFGDAEAALELRQDIIDAEGLAAIQQERVAELYGQYPASSYRLDVKL